MKRLAAMHASKNWHEQIAWASDRLLGTKFDRIFMAVQQAKALEAGKQHPDVAEKIYAFLGEQFAEIIQRGDSQSLHDLGDALNKWKKHEPQPDQLRKSLLLEGGSKKETSVRAVRANLERRGIPTDENTRRQIYRAAKPLGVKLPKDVTKTHRNT